MWLNKIKAWGYFVKEHAKESNGLVYLREISCRRNHISIPLERRFFCAGKDKNILFGNLGEL